MTGGAPAATAWGGEGGGVSRKRPGLGNHKDQDPHSGRHLFWNVSSWDLISRISPGHLLSDPSDKKPDRSRWLNER